MKKFLSLSFVLLLSNVLFTVVSIAQDRLDITAANPTAEVRTTIAKRAGGQDTFGDYDARKIINEITTIPEIYTLKPQNGGGLVAVGTNIINNDNLLIPVGLATSYAGNITFSFTGMDSYGISITFIDVLADLEVDITDMDSYEYTFNYAGSSTPCEDRFFIRLSALNPFCGGTGTVSDPYMICTAEQLDAVRHFLDKHFILNNDIELTTYLSSGNPGYNFGQGWLPLGTGSPAASFTGSFDGNGKKITGLWINYGGSGVGLFRGISNNATIQNLGVEIAAKGIKGPTYVGGLMGSAGGSSIINNCYVIGNVSGEGAVGGLMGSSSGSISISNCYTSGNVSVDAGGSGNYFGGLIGYGAGSYSISNSYSSSNVSGDSFVGGLVGITVSGTGSISNSYAIGKVIGNTYAGGLLGFGNGSYSNSFFDRQTTGHTSYQPGVISSTTENMQKALTFTSATWTFPTPWQIWETKSYPYFVNQSAPVYDPIAIVSTAIIFELRNAANSVQIYNLTTGATATLGAQTAGLKNISAASLPANFLRLGDKVQFVVYETGKTPSYPVNTVVQANTFIWTGTVNTDWNTAGNWRRGQVPTASDVAIIPGNATCFPILTTPVVVAELHFEPGAQMGNQHHLTGKAYVQYNLNQRNRYHMLSIPLKQVYPGDFTFGGYPSSWVRTFSSNVTGSSSFASGNWATLRATNVPFTLGDGFMLQLSSDPSNATDASSKGIQLLNNIHEVPYFEHQAADLPSKAQYDKIYPAHDYNGSTSQFFNFQFNGSVYERITSQYYDVSRTSAAFELAGSASITKSLDFADGNFAIVGNPYMAALDFSALRNSNAGAIKPTYQVWTGNRYDSYSAVLDPAFIAPLQGFLVEKPDIPSSTTLIFQSSMASVNVNASLRSAAVSGNRLDIVAGNSVAEVRTTVAKREVGQSTFGDFDARKIMNEISEVPEVYTLKSHKNGLVAASVNIINSDNVLIPLGLTTSYSGDITFTLIGMDTYNAYLKLIDVVANKEIDLTGLSSYDYTFNYTPTAAACEDRFFIKISNAPNSIEETVVEKVNVYESNGHIQIMSGLSNPIMEVAVFNLQGTLLYKGTSLNAVSHTISKNLPSGTYIVKVVSEKNTNNVKLIIK